MKKPCDSESVPLEERLRAAAEDSDTLEEDVTTEVDAAAHLAEEEALVDGKFHDHFGKKTEVEKFMNMMDVIKTNLPAKEQGSFEDLKFRADVTTGSKTATSNLESRFADYYLEFPIIFKKKNFFTASDIKREYGAAFSKFFAHRFKWHLRGLNREDLSMPVNVLAKKLLKKNDIKKDLEGYVRESYNHPTNSKNVYGHLTRLSKEKEKSGVLAWVLEYFTSKIGSGAEQPACLSTSGEVADKIQRTSDDKNKRAREDMLFKGQGILSLLQRERMLSRLQADDVSIMDPTTILSILKKEDILSLLWSQDAATIISLFNMLNDTRVVASGYLLEQSQMFSLLQGYNKMFILLGKEALAKISRLNPMDVLSVLTGEKSLRDLLEENDMFPDLKPHFVLSRVRCLSNLSFSEIKEYLEGFCFAVLDCKFGEFDFSSREVCAARSIMNLIFEEWSELDELFVEVVRESLSLYLPHDQMVSWMHRREVSSRQG